MFKKIASIAVLATLTACAAPVAKMSETKTGNPEIVVQKPPAAVKPVLISTMLEAGYSLSDSSDYQVKFSRPPEIEETIFMNLTMGGSATTKLVKTTANIVPIDNGKATRLIGSASYWAQSPFGQVKEREMRDNNELYNRIQQELNAVKMAIK